jgi:glycosyltransferase involved in cell wall biosynthesis
MPSLETKTLSQLTHSFLSMMHACFSKADIILVVNSANGPFGLIARLFRKKTAINVDGMEWLRPKWKGLGARYFYFASWLSTRLYDQVINDSEEMRNTYLELFQKESEVIAYGANIRQSKDRKLIERWGLQPNDYYLIVGRLIPDNNADVIVAGFCQSVSKKRLVIVGDVPYKDDYALRIKALADSDERLVFTGYVTDQNELAELYHNAFAYLHGHEFGGTNPTMLKALAYGSCILALDTRFNQEMLQNGQFGLFFAKSPASVADLVREIEDTPEKAAEMKQLSVSGITQKYTWEFVTDQYLEVFNSLSPQRKK